MKKWIAPEVEELELKNTAFPLPWDETSGEEEDPLPGPVKPGHVKPGPGVGPGPGPDDHIPGHPGPGIHIPGHGVGPGHHIGGR